MGMQRFRAPALPLATPEYNEQQLAQLIGVLRLYFTQLDSNAALQVDGIRLLNLPTSGYNLPNGTVFQIGEDLKIVVPNISYLYGVSATANVGTVTVSIT
jgi:peptidoglycan hydrolase-like protein with peptidoglycan-binding domain